MTDRELMQQALEALMRLEQDTFHPARVFPYKPTMIALRARLAQPEHEPVAWEEVLGAIARGWTHEDNKHKTMDVPLAVAIAKEVQDMIAAQQPREWVGLTESEKVNVALDCGCADVSWIELADAIEAKLQQKNI